jgi:hypothetical protein
MASLKKKTEIPPEAFPLSQVSFYFDQVERDRMDSLGTSNRTKEIMEIRSRLLTLPDGQFKATVRAVQGILQAKGDLGTHEAGPSAQQSSQPGSKRASKNPASSDDPDQSDDELNPATVALLQSQGPNP